MNTTHPLATTVRAADLKVGDHLFIPDMPVTIIPAIAKVETVVVDSRGETWDDFSLTFVTYTNGHQKQFEADAQIEIFTRPIA